MKRNNSSTGRRQRVYISAFGVNHIHYSNPILNAWLSALFPGIAHLYLGKKTKGFLLTIWEIVINVKANLNMAIIYSFTGEFEKAKMVLDKRWLLLYIAVYLFTIWDAYRISVELNKLNNFAEVENIRFKPFKMNLLDIYFLDKRNPWVSAVWSGLMPGLGQLYAGKIIVGIYIIIFWITITYFSHLAEAVHFTLLANFEKVKAIVDPEWLIFMPSIHTFAVFDAYTNTVELNKLFEIEQANYLKDNHQDLDFKMPI